jgi:hypothetical protein
MGSYDTDAAARNQKEATADTLIWEPNSEIRAAGSEGDSGKLDYVGFDGEFAAELETDLPSDKVADVKTFDTTTALMDLSKTYSKMRVYIWLEGQDVDCINNISNGDFSVTLQFAVPETVEGEG